MTEMPRFGVKDFLLLLLVLAVAGGARAAYLLGSLENLADPAPLAVEGPAGLAKDSKDPAWWLTRAPLSEEGEKTAHTAPGFPWVVGALAAALDDPERTVSMLRWANCALGTLAAGLYFFFARRAFRSSAVGTLTGLLCGLHPFWVINTLELNDGVLTCFLLAAALVLGARGSQEGEALTSLLFGLSLAALALVRAALLPFALAACLWFLLRCRRVPRGWLCALLAFLGFANGLAPWVVRNLRTFHEVVPVADSMYLHLWMGVNAAADGGPQDEKTLEESLVQAWRQEYLADKGPGAATPEDAKAAQEQAQARLQKLLAEKNQVKRYNQLAHEVLLQVRRDPAGALNRRLRAGLCFVFGRAWVRAGTLAQAQDADRLPAGLGDNYPLILEAALLGMLGFGFLGWRWTYAWRREAGPSALAVIWIPLPYILSHASELSGPRLPLDGVLLCYSAFALLCLVPGIGGYLLRGPAPPPEMGHG